MARKPNQPSGKSNIDRVFFTKESLKIGTKLEYWGRLAPGTTWEVIGIQSYQKIKNKTQWRTIQVETTNKLNDDIMLRHQQTGETRRNTFGYLSYSSIWWLK